MRLRFALALLLMASVWAGVLQEFAPHTDDGCATEIHCLACRSALGRQAVATYTADATMRLCLVATVAEDEPVQPEPIAPDVRASRGPPSAS